MSKPASTRPPGSKSPFRPTPEVQHGALRRRAWWIAGLYAAAALLWIYFSDQALGLLIEDQALLLKISVYKGFTFVAVTAILLLVILRQIFGSIAVHQAEIIRLQRLYAALSQINQSIVWSTSREELFERVCRVLTEYGGIRLAWIGWNDPATHRLTPVAIAGAAADYLENLVIYTDERPEGQGPLGRTFRLQRPYVSNRLLTDPALRMRHAELRRKNLRSAVYLPVRDGEQPGGVLAVYADETDFFRPREVELLTEATTDLAFALDNLRREAERRAAAAAVENERRFSAVMIDSMPGILYFYDMAGRFLRWNKNFETVSGYSGAEIAGMTPLDFFTPADRPRVEARIAEVFDHGESAVEAPFLAKDGSTRLHFFTGRKVEYDGKLCLVGVGIDISERHRAEQALQVARLRFAEVIEHLPAGLVIADPDMPRILWNPASLRLLGFDVVEAGRRRQDEFGQLFELSTPDGRVLTRAEWPLARACRGENFENLELRVRRLDRDWWRYISYAGAQVRYAGDHSLSFITLRDITKRRQAEEALREVNITLERKVDERTTELQSALVRAESADRTKSAFLATMSHELRTPLNSILGFTGIILQELPGPLNPEQAKQLGMVRNSARHLLDLINDVLDISKIESGQLKFGHEPFRIADAVERAVATVRPLAEKKALGLTATVAPGLDEMHGDRRRVEQILLNLLNNAIKFTERGRVTLTARAQGDAAGRRVEIAVTDTGIGIRPEDLPVLFQPFSQIDSGLARLHEGTGLGLAICRRLVTLMGGTIDVASRPGEGSTFTVMLPLPPPLPQNPSP